MTVIAIIPTGYVAQVFTDRYGAVMAGRAGPDDLCVIYYVRGSPDCNVMAVFADIAGRDVVQRLTGCIGTVVATATIAGNGRVIKIGGYPTDGRVAAIAIIATGNMRRVFADCDRIIVARLAGADNLGMVHHHYRLPERGGVAVFADVGRLNMGQALAGRIDAIMAVAAATDNICMIKNCRYPCIGGMAIVTVVAACKVRRRLACCNNIVMA